MTITQTYSLAHSARGKLSQAAAQADHQLRVLVGHANLLDSLMLDLANAEREQGQWFADNIPQVDEEAVEDLQDDWQEEDAQQLQDSSPLSSRKEADKAATRTRTPSKSTPTSAESQETLRTHPPQSPSSYKMRNRILPLHRSVSVKVEEVKLDTKEEYDDDDEENEKLEEGEEDLAALALTRVASRHETCPPPDLSSDSDSDSDSDDMPPSPPSNTQDAFLNCATTLIADACQSTTTTAAATSKPRSNAFTENDCVVLPRVRRPPDPQIR